MLSADLTQRKKKIQLSIKAIDHSWRKKASFNLWTYCAGRGLPVNSWMSSCERALSKSKCLHVFEFPTAASELNPAEYVWMQTKEYVAGTASKQVRISTPCLVAFFELEFLKSDYLPVCIILKSIG
jgi:transposase